MKTQKKTWVAGEGWGVGERGVGVMGIFVFLKYIIR